MYKKALAAALALVLVCGSLTGCKKEDSSSSSAAAVSEKAAESTSVSGTDSDTEEELQPDSASIDLSQSKKPAVLSAAVNGVFGKGTLTDIYGAEDDDRRFTEEAGLYSCPLRFECDDLRAGVITFCYDPEQLRGTPPENFRILHFREKSGSAEYMTQVLDAESGEVSAPVKEPGVYMLVDEYARRIALGQDISGLAVPEPQDEIYDGEIPYYAESRPFTVTIPLGCYGFENIADLETDEFFYHSFLRIVETKNAFVWVDISYITPKDEHSFDDMMDIIRKRLPELSVDGEIPKRTLGPYHEITSPDGTVGCRVNSTDVYEPAGINPELTFRTLCYYYPDTKGGVYEIRAQFLDNRNDPDKVTNSISERILDSFTLKEGAGLLRPGPEPTESDSDTFKQQEEPAEDSDAENMFIF